MTRSEKIELTMYYMKCTSIEKTAGEFGVKASEVRKIVNTPKYVAEASAVKSEYNPEFTAATLVFYLATVIQKLNANVKEMNDDTKIKYASLLKELLVKDVMAIASIGQRGKSKFDRIMEEIKNGNIKAQA